MVALPPPYPKRRRDWCGLPSGLLDEILTRLPLPDRVRFGRVCSPWRSALLDSCRTSRLPSWLTLSPSGPHDHLFGLDRGKLYRLRLRRSRHCIGSSMGWLVVAAREPNFEIYLLNPISGEQIDLPCNSEHPIERVRRAVLSSPPTSEDCILTVFGAEGTELAWCRPRGGGWAIVEDPPSFITDILFHDGELYVLTPVGEVLVYAFDPRPRQRGSIAPRGGSFWPHRLVASGRELLLVKKRFGSLGWCGFDVYKLDVENSQLVRIEGLDGRVLLISGVGAESFSAQDSARSGLEANCIYHNGRSKFNVLLKFSMEDDGLYQIELNGRGWRVNELDQIKVIEYVAKKNLMVDGVPTPDSYMMFG